MRTHPWRMVHPNTYLSLASPEEWVACVVGEGNLDVLKQGEWRDVGRSECGSTVETLGHTGLLG